MWAEKIRLFFCGGVGFGRTAKGRALAHCRAPASALPPGASLGGVAPPRDAILLVRAKRMQKRAKGRSPLWHPPFGAE